MKLRLNPEYAGRHLFVTVLMFGLAGWFGYDGFAVYPRTPAAELYKSIEKTDPPPDWTPGMLEDFRRQKTQTQYGFFAFTLLAGLIVGLRLLKAARFDFSCDAEGFVCGGRRYSWSQIVSADRRRWQGKGILALEVADGAAKRRITLDSWHHLGVKEFEAMLGGTGRRIVYEQRSER